jgi:hypothetical protein
MSLQGKLMTWGILPDGPKGDTSFLQNIYSRNFPGLATGYSSEIWYVDSDVSVSGNGKSWKNAFKTVKEAVTAAGDHDVILIQKGIYDEGEVLNITQEGLKIFGCNTTHHMFGTTSLKASAADHEILNIQANEVEIGHLSFIQNNANKVLVIDHTAAVYKTHIHDCHFGAATATYGVYAGGLFDAVDTHIERCHFTCGVNVGVYINGTRCSVVDCVFHVGTAGEGIVYYQDGGDRPYGRIFHCFFSTTDHANGVGVTISNTPTVGFLHIDDCHFAYFADDDHCITKQTGYLGYNYRDATVIAVT